MKFYGLQPSEFWRLRPVELSALLGYMQRVIQQESR